MKFRDQRRQYKKYNMPDNKTSTTYLLQVMSTQRIFSHWKETWNAQHSQSSSVNEFPKFDKDPKNFHDLTNNDLWSHFERHKW